jgi:hypothetical protein
VTQSPKLAPEHQMTIEEFLALHGYAAGGGALGADRGSSILNPSPIDYHQIVVTNIVTLLMRAKLAGGGEP